MFVAITVHEQDVHVTMNLQFLRTCGLRMQGETSLFKPKTFRFKHPAWNEKANGFWTRWRLQMACCYFALVDLKKQGSDPTGL